MRTIICPTDFSNTAINATKYAAAIAEKIDAKLHLIHVMHVPVVDVNSSANVLTTLMDTQKEASDLKLKVEIERLSKNTNCEIEFASQFGLAVDVIISESKKLKANLLVMGTNGASNVFDQLLGTVSFGVAKRSEVPVIVVPPASQFTGLKRIAFADDHKESLNEQREFLYHLTSGLESKIDLISVDVR
ncbi:MAG: universal stress protein, partial [Bacteroidia bacterium]|nr:universal stress protein [Bacteroidia bacterium]